MANRRNLLLGICFPVGAVALMAYSLNAGGEGNVPSCLFLFLSYTTIGSIWIHAQDWQLSEKHNLLLAFWAAMAFRITLSPSIFSFYMHHQFGIHDAMSYLFWAKMLLADPNLTVLEGLAYAKQLFATDHFGYYQFVALHGLLGESPYLIFITQSFLGSISVVISYRIIRNLLPNLPQKILLIYGVWIAMFFPFCIFWTNLPLKDALCAFITLSLIDQIYLAAKGRFGAWIWILLALFILARLRFYYIPIGILTLVGAAWAYPKSKGFRRTTLLLIIAYPIVGWFLFQSILVIFLKVAGMKNIPLLDFAAVLMDGETSNEWKPGGVGGTIINTLRFYGITLPWYAPDSVPQERLNVLSALLTWHTMAPFAIVGLAGLWKQSGKYTLPIMIYLGAAVLIAGLFPALSSPRRMVHLLPILLLLVPYGFSRLGRISLTVPIFYLIMVGAVMVSPPGMLKFNSALFIGMVAAAMVALVVFYLGFLLPSCTWVRNSKFWMVYFRPYTDQLYQSTKSRFKSG